MQVVSVVLAMLLTLVGVLVGLSTVQHLPASIQVREAAGFSARSWKVLGWLELAAAALLIATLFAAPGVAAVGAAVLAVAFAVIAVAQLVRQRSVSTALPAGVIGLVAFATTALLAVADR